MAWQIWPLDYSREAPACMLRERRARMPARIEQPETSNHPPVREQENRHAVVGRAVQSNTAQQGEVRGRA